MSEKSSWSATSERHFKSRLSRFARLKVEVRFNENRSTMLSLLEKRRSSARLSVHKMFLEAPDEVVAAVAAYVKGSRDRRGETYHQVIRSYIEEQLSQHKYRYRLDPARLITVGTHYDLRERYEHLNALYFRGKLALNITWYGRSFTSKRPHKITYGLYETTTQLVKIHRMLDDPFFPPYFVDYVIYHEMLHAVVPGERNARGQFCIHTPAFKEQEARFIDYQKALRWEKRNKEKIFSHGRS